MTARLLEAAGIATVIIGSAMDIVTHCGVPRYLHQDFPLGNPLGHPYNSDEQLETVRRALKLFASEETVIEASPLKWHNGDAWRQNYMKIDASNIELLKQMGIENRRKRTADTAAGLKR